MDVGLFTFDPEDDHGNDPDDNPGLKIFWAADAESNFPLVAKLYLGRPVGQQHQDQQQLLVQNGQQQYEKVLQSPKNQRKPQGRCCFCYWKDDRKTCSCVSCRNWVCQEHAAHVCPDCASLLQTKITIVYRHADELPRAMPPPPSPPPPHSQQSIETMVNNKLNTRRTVWAVGKRCLSHLYLWPCCQNRSA